MADKLQGIWVFDKFTGESNSDTELSQWEVNFTSNGKQFAKILLRSSSFVNSIYNTTNTSMIQYYYPDGVTNASGDSYERAFLNTSSSTERNEDYFSINITSTYDEVENADTLLQALSARATFTPNTNNDINISMTSASGVILKTAGKYCDKDIVVTPNFETGSESTEPNIQALTITENGTYTASGNIDGYSPITVNVASSGGGSDDSTKCIEELHSTLNLQNATKIKQYLFYKDKTLTSLTMPNVTSIGDMAFYDCQNLVLTSLPSGLVNIGSASLQQCYKLAITSIPSGVTSIGANAFRNCTMLASLTFEGTPTSIEANSFYGCSKIKTINVPWAEGAVANAPWGATNATINYNYTGG